jgi:hypothetical protein
MPPRRYYHPVPRGLEGQIAEKLARLAELNAEAVGAADPVSRDDPKAWS